MSRRLPAPAFVLFALSGFALFGFAPSARAQEDADGLKDHPVFARHPAYWLSSGEDIEFGAFEFGVKDAEPAKAEGRYTRRDYTLKENTRNPGAIALARNYRNALTAKGAKILNDDVGNGGGTFSAVMTSGGAKVWIQLDINNSAEVYTMHVIEEEAMQQKVVLGANELAKALADDGRVAVRGILFDTGKATLKPESAAALGPIVELLKSDAALKLEIQGHTDNAGAAAANLKLSQDRAAAVKDYLVRTGGVAAARLTTSGFGNTKPVADNATEAGRALNRRVELVKK